MLTYNIKDFPSKSDEINAALDNGEEIAIIRNGKIWFTLGSKQNSSAERKEREPGFSSLREALVHARGGREFTMEREPTEEDFQSVKTMWRMPVPDQNERSTT